MDVIILVLLPFSLKEFIDFGFQVSIWNLEFARGQILDWFVYQICSFNSSLSNVAWDPAYKDFFTVWLWI